MDVSVKLQQYKGDLLLACTEMVLSAPAHLIPLHHLVHPLAVALTVGLRYRIIIYDNVFTLMIVMFLLRK